MLTLGVLASGSGSNFQSIIDNIESDYLDAKIVVLITDRPGIGAIERAKKHNIEHLIIKPGDFSDRPSYNSSMAEELKKRDVELVILAGFMRVVDKTLIDRYPNRIMNIHPALLPSFPGLHGQKQAADHECARPRNQRTHRPGGHGHQRVFQPPGNGGDEDEKSAFHARLALR